MFTTKERTEKLITSPLTWQVNVKAATPLKKEKLNFVLQLAQINVLPCTVTKKQLESQKCTTTMRNLDTQLRRAN